MYDPNPGKYLILDNIYVLYIYIYICVDAVDAVDVVDVADAVEAEGKTSAKLRIR